MFGIGLGPTEMLIVGVLAVLLFGSKLPTVARSVGRSLTEFRRGMQDLQDNVRRTMEAEELALNSALSDSPNEPETNEQYTGVNPESPRYVATEPSTAEPKTDEQDDQTA